MVGAAASSLPEVRGLGLAGGMEAVVVQRESCSACHPGLSGLGLPGSCCSRLFLLAQPWPPVPSRISCQWNLELSLLCSRAERPTAGP